MGRSILLVMCLVTLYAQLGQSQDSGKINKCSLIAILKCVVSAVRIAAAVYEALGPIINEIKDDIRSVKRDIAHLSQKVGNLTEEVEGYMYESASQLNSVQSQVDIATSEIESLDSNLVIMNSSIGNSLNWIKKELSSINKTMCDEMSLSIIEEYETEIMAELMENLTLQFNGYTCGGTAGWRRAVYLDMTDFNVSCPSGWRLLTEDSKKTCVRNNPRRYTCDSVFFPVSGGPYNQVCGRIRAYQWGLTQAFHGYIRHRQSTVDSIYSDGMAVMHGSPRQHIWTFAAGVQENDTRSRDYNCPCDNTEAAFVPSFVGEDYFCESGYMLGSNTPVYNRLHSNDTLWDGMDCPLNSTCCSFSDPPYFTKTLNQTTTDDLELRACSYHGRGDVALELVELYVKDDCSAQLDRLHLKLDSVGEKIAAHETTVKTKLMEINQNINILHHIDTCGDTGGWRRAVYLNMRDTNTDCPTGWRLTGYSKRTCGRVSTGSRTCDSVFFQVSGGSYSQVCGRIRAYQWGLTDGFVGFNAFGQTTIDSAYVDGVAVMHGSPRQHIWTFAAGAWENDTILRLFNCPCDTTSNLSIPSFVGNDYVCESGYVYPGFRRSNSEYIFHQNDTLWDGRDCHSTSTCCSFNNPPYFTKALSQTTADDLELRMCFTGLIWYRNIAVELVELYVK